MTKKVWTPHDVTTGQEISYRGNAHGIYDHIFESFDVKALEDASADDEVLAELTPRERPRREGTYCGQCGKRIKRR